MPILNFISNISPSALPAATARLPSSYKIDQFVADSNGLDDVSTSTITMLHNQDSVILTNPYEGTTAHFIVKTVTARSELELTGWKKQPSKTVTKDLTLAPGETASFTVAEGTDYEPETGFLPEKVNQDIYITLSSVDVVDESGEKKTFYTGAGQNVFGFDLQRRITDFRNHWALKRLRGGKAVIMGLRCTPAMLARPPVGGAGRGGDYPGAVEGPSSAASYGVMRRSRPY